jgi:hypothetical protein
MNKIAAVLLTASMLTSTALASNVASTSNTHATQKVNPEKITKTSDTDVKKHNVHARASHGHKVHYAKHAKPSQVKHASKISKKNPTSANTKSDLKAVATAPVKTSVKN